MPKSCNPFSRRDETGVLGLIVSRRSIRQFQSEPLSEEVLHELVNAARLAPSAANRQPLEFIAVRGEQTKNKIFPCLKWAGYIAPEGNPRSGKEPQAYIVTLVNTSIRAKSFERDVGAAMENMILAAWSLGIGSCWIVTFDSERIRSILGIPEGFAIDSVLALGYPAESPSVEDLRDSVQYWKDEEGKLHVPKRRLESVLHREKF